MCTLVLAAHALEGHPLVVVANRDELVDRASLGPSLWSPARAGAARFVAPRDEVAGGTWLGVNDAGVFVGITNRYLGPKDPARTSRGALVAAALELRSARAIHDAMAKVSPARHNAFHLVYADQHDVLATVSDGSHIAQLTLGPGLHVVTERSFGAGDDSARRRRIRARWDELTSGSQREPVDIERLSGVLADHDDVDPLAATCIHFEPLRYGTRSGTVIAIGGAHAERRMLWAEGPPCRTPFSPVDLSPLDVPGSPQSG